MTLFPRASSEESEAAFSGGRLAEMPADYREDLRPYGVDDILAGLAARGGITEGQIGGVYGLDPARAARIMMLAQAERIGGGRGIEEESGLICPRCGRMARARRIQDGRRFVGWVYLCDGDGHGPVASVVCPTKRWAAEAFGRGLLQETGETH